MTNKTLWMLITLGLVAIIYYYVKANPQQINPQQPGLQVPNIAQPSPIQLNIILKSSAFNQGQPIPKKYAYTGEGENISPPLSWSNIPKNTQSFALILDDPDAPLETAWVHWGVFNIPANVTSIAEGSIPDGSTQGKNNWGNNKYDGPMPPAGKAHRYFFKIYALNVLNVSIDLTSPISRALFEKKMKSNIVGYGELMGTYKR